MSGSMETNTTEETYTNEDFNMTLLKILNVLYVVVVPVMCLLGITGNGLVIWFVAFRMKKTVNSVWFLSLAFADFTFCFFLPLTVTYIALDFHWPFGTFICKLYLFAFYLNQSASVLQLTIISIDRCISVVFPVWCRNHRTVRLAVKVVLAIWIVSLLLSVSYFTNTSIYNGGDTFVYCVQDWVMHNVQTIIRFIVLFLIAFIIIIFSYTVLFLRIQRNHRAKSTKPFKVIAAVIISFFICWFPYYVFSIMDFYSSYTLNSSMIVIYIGRRISSMLAYSNSCVNPLLYVLIGQDFKQKFWIAIKYAFERTFIEDANATDPNPNRHRFLPDHAISQM